MAIEILLLARHPASPLAKATLLLSRRGAAAAQTLAFLVLLTIGLQLLVLYLPVLDQFFQVTPLRPVDLQICAGLGAILFGVIEIEKWIRRTRSRGQAQSGPAPAPAPSPANHPRAPKG